MGLRILYDHVDDIACMYDSVSGWAFGPTFEGDNPYQDVQDFIDWLPEDARKYDLGELERLHAEWCRKREVQP